MNLSDLADLLAPSVDDSGPAPTLRLEPALVTAVNTTGAADGGPLVTLAWRGASIVAPYVSAWTPNGGSVGVAVALLVSGSTVLILGPVRGAAPDPIDP